MLGQVKLGLIRLGQAIRLLKFGGLESGANMSKKLLFEQITTTFWPPLICIGTAVSICIIQCYLGIRIRAMIEYYGGSLVTIVVYCFLIYEPWRCMTIKAPAKWYTLTKIKIHSRNIVGQRQTYGRPYAIHTPSIFICHP